MKRTDGWTFFIVTFGCKVNQYESQSLREAWRALGGTEVEDAAQAQVILINSCAVTAHGERDARHALYQAHRHAPGARRILTGCAARLAGERLKGEQAPEVLVPPEHKALLLAGPWAVPEPLPEIPVPRPFPPFAIGEFRRARPVLKVQDGCSHRCTYCIVPLMRGPAVSRPAAEATAEARRLLEAGHREIMLSGINLHQYGRDGGPDFWDLLALLDRELAPQWAGRARLRISSLEPSQLDARGLEVLATHRLVCPHLHLSLQSGSPAILRRMGRGHTRLDALTRSLETLSRHWPAMGLGADILMGFPGEGEEQVRETLAVVEALPLTYAHVFPYSRRPGTPAASFPDQVPHEEKLRRAAAVRAVVSAHRKVFLREQARLPRMWVAPEGPGDRGVNEWYVPCRVRAATTPTRELLAARPVAVEGNGLIVEPVTP